MGKQTRSLLIKLLGSALILFFVLFRLIDFDKTQFIEIVKQMNLKYYLFSLFWGGNCVGY